MVGKFLLGMVSGGLLVTGGLVMGSMLFPTGPANDNAPVADPVADVAEPIATPEATTPKAGETIGTETAEAVTAEDPTPKPEEAVEPVAVAKTEAKPEEEPVVVPTDPAPEAPKADAAVAEPDAPAVAEVEKPTTTAEPSKPATGAADAAATTPEPAAPAPAAAPETSAPETKLAEAATAPAEPAPKAEPVAPATAEPDTATKAAPSEEPAPVVAADPAAEPTTPPLAQPPAEPAPVEPAPVELAQNDDAPAAEPAVEGTAPEAAATAATETTPAVTEPAAEAPAVQAPAEAAPVEKATPDVAPDAVAEPPAAEEPAAEPSAAEPSAVEPPAAEPPVVEAPAADPAAEDPADPMPAAPEAEAAPGAAVAEMPGTKPAALPGTAEDAEADPSAVATEETEDSPTFKPAPGLIRSGEGVIIGRGTDEVAEAAPADGTAPVDPRPIAQFAATFENPDAKPAFAIVLVDDGSPDLDRAGLAALPFPVSFALDPLDPATPERAAIYRAGGREVVMLVTGIADGAQASDVEVAFQSMELGLPEAVAVMDLADPTFQNNRGLAAAVVPILKAEGRGLLTWDEGLNAADQVARREDLEAAVLFRDLDQAGGDPVAVRRLLDRAVFKAGQDGVVSVVAKADPATVAALLEWTVEGKAATVALAPLTAVLKVD